MPSRTQSGGKRKLSAYNLFMRKFLNANLKSGMTKTARLNVMRMGAKSWRASGHAAAPKASRKTSRKGSRKSSRKASRKHSRKGSRKSRRQHGRGSNTMNSSSLKSILLSRLYQQ
jgi:hypothetical protein